MSFIDNKYINNGFITNSERKNNEKKDITNSMKKASISQTFKKRLLNSEKKNNLYGRKRKFKINETISNKNKGIKTNINYFYSKNLKEE